MREVSSFLLGYISKLLGIFQKKKEEERREDAERRVKNKES
jgi:hypothetical protein